MNKLLAFLLVACLMAGLCACGGPSGGETTGTDSRETTAVTEPVTEPATEPATEPPLKTSLTVAELAEGAYTGTLSGSEFVNNNETIFTTIMPADVTVTVENGQITLYSDSTTTAYGVLNGVKTPQAPDTNFILSGSLPLQQSGDAVIAEGELTSLGKSFRLFYTDGEFDRWELEERSGDGKYACTVHIAMTDSAPVATIVVDLKEKSSLTATVPLALASGAKAQISNEPLSAPYAALLRSGDYQYTYAVEYGGLPYLVTVAAYDGMRCSRNKAELSEQCERTVSKGETTWLIYDHSGEFVKDGKAGKRTMPDYASTLTFAATRTLETGAICDAYDYEYLGKKSNMVFVFSPEGKLAELIITHGEDTYTLEIVSFTKASSDLTLFDVPE